MLEKLTRENDALIPGHIAEWIDKCLYSPKTNKNIEYINHIYGLAKIQPPEIIYAESPMGVQLIGSFLKDRRSVRDSVRDSVEDSVWKSVGKSVEDSVGKSVRDSFKYEPFLYAGIFYDSYWVAFYDYFEKIKINIPKEFKTYNELIKNSHCAFILPFQNLCIVSRPHTAIRRENDLLHSDQKPAIEWADGYKLYYLKGVEFTFDEWSKIKDKTFTIKDLMGIDNADKRAVALSMLSPEVLLKHVGGKLINTGSRGTKLYKVENLLDTNRTEYCITMKCPSTGRDFLEWVLPEVGEKGDADLCQRSAWTDDKGKILSQNDYKTMVEA